MAEWPLLIEVLESGLATEKKHVAALHAARTAEGRERIDEYLKIFCTTELTPRKNIVTKAIAQNHPEWLARLQAEQDRVCRLLGREQALAARERTRALVTIAAEVIGRYRREKDRRGLLDYDDLIDKTLDLFSRASAAWVLYKLDLGIDHVLIDEAQYTSKKQWEIIGSTMGSYVEFAQVTDLVARGLPVLVDQVFPLERYPEALERLAGRGQIGKIVLRHPDRPGIPVATTP